MDQADLLKALEPTRIAGATLDVFEQEPLPEDSSLREFARKSNNKLYLIPHLGSGREESQRQVAIEVAEKVGELLYSYLGCYIWEMLRDFSLFIDQCLILYP